MIYIFSGMLSYRADGLWAGHVHIWGDWSVHIAMANIFAYKDPSEWFRIILTMLVESLRMVS
jgi:hypothetical protein